MKYYLIIIVWIVAMIVFLSSCTRIKQLEARVKALEDKPKEINWGFPNDGVIVPFGQGIQLDSSFIHYY